jgi:hypothetical protein
VYIESHPLPVDYFHFRFCGFVYQNVFLNSLSLVYTMGVFITLMVLLK